MELIAGEFPGKIFNKLASGAISVILVGRPFNWELSVDDGNRNKAFPRIGKIAKYFGIRDVLAPSVRESNGEICEMDDLLDKTHLLPSEEDSPIIWRGVMADGTEVPEGGGVWISSADCPTIIVHDPKTRFTIMAHASIDSLIDRRKFVTKEGRRAGDVTGKISKQFSLREFGRSLAYVFCGISGKNFVYSCDPVKEPEYCKVNERLIAEIVRDWGEECLLGDPKNGCISLRHIIRSQLIDLGMDEENIFSDASNTYSDLDESGYVWWSRKRGDKERNGVLCIRHL